MAPPGVVRGQHMQKRERHRIARNAATSYGVRLLLALNVLILTPYLFRTLGAAGFGTWSAIFTLLTVFSLVEVGFSAGVVKYVAQFRAEGRETELQALVRTGVALMGALGVISAIASVAIAYLLTGIAAEPDRDDFRLGMLVVAGAMLIRFPCVAYAAALNGLQRYDLYNASWSFFIVSSAVGSVVAVEAGTGVLGVTVSFAVALALGGILYVIMLRRIEPQLRLTPAAGDRRARGRIFAFSSFALLADSMVFMAQRMDVLIIAAIRGAAAAGPYAAAVKLQSGLQSLVLPFVDLLMPMTSDLWARGERTEVVRRLTLATRLAVQVASPAAVGIALFSSDIVRLWLGESAPGHTASIVVVLMAVQALLLAATPAEKLLVGIGRVRILGGLAVVEGVTNILVTIALIIRYGAIGAALGTLLTSSVLAPIKFPLVCRATGTSLARFLVDAVGRALASSAPAVAAMAAVYFAFEPGGSRVALGGALGAFLTIAVGLRQVGGLRRLREFIRERRAEPGVEPGRLEDQQVVSNLSARSLP